MDTSQIGKDMLTPPPPGSVLETIITELSLVAMFTENIQVSL